MGTKKIVFVCAFRDEKSHGGPGNVAAMQKNLFGNKYRDIDLEYLFKPEGYKLPQEVFRNIEDLSPSVKLIVRASYFITSSEKIKQEMYAGSKILLVCHDIGTAYGAFQLGCKYVLVYHQQGSILNEMRAFGTAPSSRDQQVVNDIEKVVFENAEEVYFPSVGAGKMFLETSEYANFFDGVNYAEHALYNTVCDEMLLPTSVEELENKLNLPHVNRENTQVFLSVGDYNVEKGMDRIPAFLNEYSQSSEKEVLWVCIGYSGTGHIYNPLIEDSVNWHFQSVLIGERVNHDILLALMNYADCYIMLHRRAIFDLATLEAMKAGKAIILSAVGGNPELNVEDNIVLWSEGNTARCIEQLRSRTFAKCGEKNKLIFEQYFSKEAFAQAYGDMLIKHTS